MTIAEIIKSAIEIKESNGHDFTVNYHASNEDVYNEDFTEIQDELFDMLIDSETTAIDGLVYLRIANDMLANYHLESGDTSYDEPMTMRDFLTPNEIRSTP